MRRREESGAVTVIVAVVVSAILLVLCAIVVDLGHARDVKTRAQNAADASALAGANALYLASSTPDFAAAVAAAKTYASVNYETTAADWTGCTDSAQLAYVPPGETPCISFDRQVRPTKIRVLVPIRQLTSRFAGGTRVDVAASARATLRVGGSQPCGLCVLGSGILHNFQNGDAVVNGGDIYINGSSTVSNNGLIASSGSIYVEGTAAGGMAQYQPDPITSVPPIPDPLAGLVVPPDMTGLIARSDPCTEGPGIYTGRNLRNSTCNLQPGLYVVREGTWDLAGNSSTNLNGTGVTIYLTCSTGSTPRACNSGEQGATIDASGNGNLNLTAPTSGPLQGVTILMDRNNTSTLRLTGNGTLGFTGAVYAASAQLQMNGNGCSNGINSMVVVRDIEFNGNPSCLTVNYQASQNPEPAPGQLHLDE